jgi:hypothetical protein
VKKIIFVLVLAAGFAAQARATFAITGNIDAMTLANAFIAPGTGITIENAFISNTKGQLMTGTFTDGPLGIGNGIILTSGLATAALPPNNHPQESNDMHLPGDPIVDNIIGASVYPLDTVILAIVFSADPSINSIEFTSIFGSEEYPDYRGSRFNDTFGVFLNGTLKSNQIVFDYTGAPIMINGPLFSPGNVITSPADGMQYNGSTPLLTTKAAITPGSTGNVMRIVISDVGDRALDSGVLLSGFRGSSDIITTPVTQKSSPTDTPTITPTWTITQTHTVTPTYSATPTITETWTITETHTITETYTASPTFTVTPTFTATPVVFILTHKGNFPNPFTDKTDIIYWLSRQAKVDIKIYTVSGEVVRNDTGMNAVKGNNSYTWEGQNSGGASVASGVYIYRILAVSEYGEKAEAWGKTSRVR